MTLPENWVAGIRAEDLYGVREAVDAGDVASVDEVEYSREVGKGGLPYWVRSEVLGRREFGAKEGAIGRREGGGKLWCKCYQGRNECEAR